MAATLKTLRRTKKVYISYKAFITNFPGDSHWVLADMEDFDEVLDRGVWCLSDQRLRSDSDIADKRRDKPRQIESMFGDHLRSQEELDANAKKPMAFTNDDVDSDVDGKSLVYSTSRSQAGQFFSSF
jgi:hypothetical protein